jgi:hypothetical protein
MKSSDTNNNEITTHSLLHKARKVPPGEAKSEILIYLANNGPIDTATIREHLKTHLNIKNKRMTYLHLNELMEKKHLGKISSGKGKTDLYFLLGNFVALKQTFNYLKRYHKEMDFIKTKYFKSYVSSEDFRARTFIYVLKEFVLTLIEYVKSDKVYDALIKKTNGSSETVRGLDVIRASDISTAKYVKASDFSKVMKLCKIKKPDRAQILSSMLAILKNTDVDTIFSSLLLLNPNSASIIDSKFLNILIPKKEIPEISIMMRSSPTAINYVLNFELDSIIKQLDFMGLVEILIKSPIVRVIDDPAKSEEILQNENNVGKILESLKDFSNVENRSPIYTLISSTFIYDFLHKNLDVQPNDREAISNILGNIFLPKIKHQEDVSNSKSS